MLYALSQNALHYAVLTLLALPSLITPVSSAPTSSLSARGAGTSTVVTIAAPGVGLFAHYRIVALANLGSGVLLAAYDGRPDGGDSPSPNSILQRRSTDFGATWGDATYIARGQLGATGVQKYGFSDPSYVVDQKTGKVFNFHVFSKNQGFVGSVLGNDDTNLNVISSEVSVSTDGGLTWSTDPTNQPKLPPVAAAKVGAPPLLTSAVKPVGSTVNGIANVGGVTGQFATSGEGIQLRYGAHAGRLIQQFAANIIQPSGAAAHQAYSVYSDDAGATWHMGTPIGTGMDENKVVELSDGRVMLNSRPGDGVKFRKVAISTDGGVTYSAPTADTQLPDPGNNGAIARAYPDAAEGSKEAKILLFTNAASQTARAMGTIRFSCDDGTTWSAGRVFQTNAMAYSTVTAIGGDQFGIFYEGPDSKLFFSMVDKAYIGISC